MTNKFEDALNRAKKAGHQLQNDPPVFSSMERHTCRACGRAVLGNYSTAYGSATEEPCPKAEESDAS